MVFGSKSVSFNAEHIPSLNGKVILVTGGNIGLGKQCVLDFSRHNPSQIWLAARDLSKAKVAADEIKQQVPDAPIKLLELDLTSFESVKKAVKIFYSESNHLDILMLNAGIMATPPGLTTDGYEIQFGTNHMGHALLTKLLLPALEKTSKSSEHADVRIVSLSSQGHAYSPKGGIQFDTLKTPADGLGALSRYGQSKLANVLWARQLAKVYPQFTVAAIHPGVVRTNLSAGATGLPFVLRMLGSIGSRFFTSVDEGAKNQLWASVSKDVKSGEYYKPVGVGDSVSAYGKDDDLANSLWNWTEKELEAYTDCAALRKLAPNAEICAAYGTTETSRSVSYCHIKSHAEDPNALHKLGDILAARKGIENVQLLVVNREDPTKLCGVGEVGEMLGSCLLLYRQATNQQMSI